MIFALLPVKAPQIAKQRLSGFLGPGQREQLARTMYQEVLATLCAVRGLDRIVVVTNDPLTAQQATRAGAEVFEEQEQFGHSHSADRAARNAMQLGAHTVLMLPIDVPLVTAAEIERLVQAAGPGLIIVPSADGAGTNALVRTPPDIIESRFGPASFRAHIAQAQAKSVSTKVIWPPGLVFDIDTPADVAELMLRAPGCKIAQLLRAQSRVQSSVCAELLKFK